MWINTNNGEIIKNTKPITINEIQYPASIFELWNNEKLSAIGIKSFTEEYYDKKYYNAIDYIDEDVDGVIVRSYVIEPKTSEEDIIAQKLYEKKLMKINDIDTKSIEILTNGFSYGGQIFDILTDEERWKELLLAATAELLSYPITVYSKDKVGVAINNTTEAKTFCATFMATRESVLQPARVLKEQVMECATQEELDAIIDER